MADTRTDDRAYVGVAQCGCVVAAMTARVAHLPESRREISRWLKDGLSVERMDVEEVRRQLFTCTHDGKLPLGPQRSWRSDGRRR